MQQCGCEWNISIKAYIPTSGYVCPHCTSREREEITIQEDKHMANRITVCQKQNRGFQELARKTAGR